jgi:hypothetical protein
VSVELVQTAFESGAFMATLDATKPAAVHQSFCVQPSWSGHFFNLDDATGRFHLRIRGVVPTDSAGDDNVQLYADATMQSTIVASDTIVCTIDANQ